MVPWTLSDIERALRSSWTADICSPDDLPQWHPGNPARGQCDITALVVHDLLGGELILGEVHVNGVRRGHHWWNRLSTEVEIDLTREQFEPDEVVTNARLIERPRGPLGRREREYEELRRRIADLLGPLPRRMSGHLV
ncbi:YunG family protein [Wenjunlia tyrosinilytica]|nr:hypothetical protein [Wenjunlia tyrosinilytica]